VFGLSRTVRPDEIVFGTDTVVIAGQPAAAPFRNAANPFDVNADSVVSPMDALLVINELEVGGRALTTVMRSTNASRAATPQSYVDVNGDNIVSPIDALLVINQIGEPVPLSAAAPLGLRVELPVGVFAVSILSVSDDDAASDTGLKQESPHVANHGLTVSNGRGDQAVAFPARVWEAWNNERMGNRSLAGAAAGNDLDGILEDVAHDVMDAWRAS
jgi:hypothetical protein